MNISPKQAYWADRLLAERAVSDELRAEVERRRCSARTPRDFSPVMDILFALPKVQRQPLPQLEPGTYEHDGVIFRVQISKQSGRPYAKVWEGHGWVYDSQAYSQHAASAVVVPLERAIAIGVATGHCVCCARDLTDPVSVEAGIGPVCVGRYGTTREEIIASRKRGMVCA